MSSGPIPSQGRLPGVIRKDHGRIRRLEVTAHQGDPAGQEPLCGIAQYTHDFTADYPDPVATFFADMGKMSIRIEGIDSIGLRATTSFGLGIPPNWTWEAEMQLVVAVASAPATGEYALVDFTVAGPTIFNTGAVQPLLDVETQTLISHTFGATGNSPGGGNGFLNVAVSTYLGVLFTPKSLTVQVKGLWPFPCYFRPLPPD